MIKFFRKINLVQSDPLCIPCRKRSSSSYRSRRDRRCSVERSGKKIKYGIQTCHLFASPPRSLINTVHLCPVSFVFQNLFIIRKINFHFILTADTLKCFFYILKNSHCCDCNHKCTSGCSICFSPADDLHTIDIGLYVIEWNAVGKTSVDVDIRDLP